MAQSLDLFQDSGILCRNFGSRTDMNNLLRPLFLTLFVASLSGCGWFAVDDQREQNDIQIVQVGQQATLVVPTDQLFYPHSANFTPHAYDILDGAAAYLSSHKVAHINIRAYMNGEATEDLNVILSKAQSGKVMNYLWAHMRSPVWMEVWGMGSHNNIAKSSNERGRQRNRRIDISFMDGTVS